MFLPINLIFGQIDNYRLDLDFIYHATGDGRSICENNVKILVIYFDGSRSGLILDQGETDFQMQRYPVSSKRIIGINITARAVRNNSFGNCSGDDEDINRDFYFDNTCQYNYISYQSEAIFNATTIYGNFSARVVPLHTLAYPTIHGLPNSADTFLPAEDKVTIRAKTGFAPSLYTYQYKFETEPESSYINISQSFSNLNELSVSAIDLFGVNGWETHSGKKINFRVVSCPEGNSYASKSFPITLRIVHSAPHILPTPTFTLLNCFEDTSGSYTLNFDRQIIQNVLQNESLSLVVNGRNGTPDMPITSFENIQAFQTGNTYTLNNIPKGDYRVTMIGNLNIPANTSDPNVVTYTTGVNHKYDFSIIAPPKLTFTTTTTNVNCFGGSDGTITITASGGTLGGVATDGIDYQFSRNGGANWQPFSNGNVHTITGLLDGNYTIQVKDANNCVAKNNVPEEINIPLTISTVQQAVQLVNAVYKLQPTFNGATNGLIKATIKGGTRISNDNQAYNYVWKKKVGNVFIPFAGGIRTTQYNDLPTAQLENNLEIKLDNIPAGEYALTVTDKNYATAIANSANIINSAGCSIIDEEIILLEPAKIEVTFTKTNPRCNAENQFGYEEDNIAPFNTTGITRFRDESHDGKIIATVTGGVQFSGTGVKPYLYFWQKKIAGVWTNIINENNILENIGDGEYSFNVQDFNGYRLGTFDNIANVQSVIIDVPNLIVQPAKLNLALTKTDVNCGGINSGTAKAFPQGGVPPYVYKWSNLVQSTTQEIQNLAAGNYFVLITDANGCIVQGNIVLPPPSGVTISNIATNPKCFNGDDGKIDLVIENGNPPFEYFWNGNVELDQPNFLANLSAGNYSVIIKDSKGCEFSESATLIDPPKIIVDLGADRTLCNGQKHDLDITITDNNPTYTWTSNNGYTSNLAQVSLTQAGIYRAKIVTSLGCIAEDEIEIKTNQVNIESEFFVTSQAYVGEDVILVNTSNPFGQNTEWVYPADAIVVSQEPKFTVLKFDTPGSKAVSLKQTQGDCFALYSKNINVEDRGNIPNSSNNNSPFIKDFLVTPIPVKIDGNFTAVINLQEISPIKLRLYSLVGQNAIIQKSEAGAKNYVVDFNLNIASGTYVLVLETAKQTLIRKIIKL